MKKYRNYLISLLIIITFCISICFVPIDATKFIPQVEKQFEQELGIKIHIEKLIFRFGTSLKIKAPLMHLMYDDGQKFGQLNNVKFYVPWSTLFKDDVIVKKIYTDEISLNTSSSDKKLPDLLNILNSKEYDTYPNLQLKNYSLSYNNVKLNKKYSFKGSNLEITKLVKYKNLKVVADGDFYINDKHYINYKISITPEIEPLKPTNNFDDVFSQIENLDFHSNINADLKLYNNYNKELQISGVMNVDDISVLDPMNKNPKSFIYLTFMGNKTGLLSNIYATHDKKIYAQGVINNSKKSDVDIKVKTDEIEIGDIYNKLKLFIDCSKYKSINTINGKMHADFSIKGNLNKLKSTGFIKISDGSIKAGSVLINNINSDIDLSGNLIKIREAKGFVNSAPITLTGDFNNKLNLNLIMDKIELKNIFPEGFGVKNGIISLNAKIEGTTDNPVHKESIKIDSFKAVKNNYAASFDSFKVDTNKENVAYISNLALKPPKTEIIKIPTLKLVLKENNISIPDTNIFMPNSKIKAKLDVKNYNNSNISYESIIEGFIHSKDINNFLSVSSIYPIKFNINGNKQEQNINGKIQMIQSTIFDEPSVVNINAKLEKDTLKLDDISITGINTGNNQLKNNIKGKKITLSGTIENLKDPVFKNIRIFIPQQINLNINDVIAQIKGDIFINGPCKKPEIIGQLSAQNIIVQFMQLMVNNLTVDFNKNTAVINAPVIKISDMSSGITGVINTDFSKGILFKSLNVKSKFFNADTLLMYKDKVINSLPVIVENGKFYSERVAASLYNTPIYITAFNSDFSVKNNTVNLKNITGELYNGNLSANINFNLKDESYKGKIQARGVSAAPIFDIVIPKKDSISGVMDFDSELSGDLNTKQNLNGNIKFIVHNGHLGTLGKLEHLLYAQNVVADNMLRTTLSVVTTAITLKDTGLFKYLRGDITLKNGIANIEMLQSQGPLMSLFIKGQYNPTNDYAKLFVLGRLSDEIVSGLGAFGEFSFNKLLIMLTGDDNKLNIKVDDLEKLPQLPMRNTKEFRSIINGTLEKPSSVIMFNWISYSQKSLRQPDIPSSNTKVPDFIEALPY